MVEDAQHFKTVLVDVLAVEAGDVIFWPGSAEFPPTWAAVTSVINRKDGWVSLRSGFRASTFNVGDSTGHEYVQAVVEA